MTYGISLIIPTYNRAAYLRSTLESVARMRPPAGVEWEVLVIDNNCTDETPAVVETVAQSFPCELRHIIEHQQGLCFGRNRGLAEARFEHLAYLDDDIRVSPDWVASYFEAVNDWGADAVAGPVFPLFEQTKPSYLVGRALEIISSEYSRKGGEIQVLPQEVAHELPGCNFGVTKVAAQSIGGFDITLDRVGGGLLAGGDTDFGLRLVAAGKRTVFHPGCSIEHVMLPEKTTKPYLRRRAYGLGATVRVMRDDQWHLPLRTQARYYAGIGRMALEAAALRLRGDGGKSFSRELEARQALGFITTNPRRHSSLPGEPPQPEHRMIDDATDVSSPESVSVAP